MRGHGRRSHPRDVERTVAVTPIVAPVVSAVTPNTGAMAGGTAITNLAGTGFQVGDTVTFDGVAATSVVFVSSVKLTCVTPSGSAGTADIVVTHTTGVNSGSSGNALFTYAAPFVLADLTPELYFKAPFGGVPWVPTTPGDTHGNLINYGAAGTEPTVGPAVSGSLTPARMSGVLQALKSGTSGAPTAALGTGSGAFTIVAFVQLLSTQVAPGADYITDPAILTDEGGYWGLVTSTSGIRAGIYDSAYRNTPQIALATGVWAMAVMRYDGTNIKCRVSQPSGTTDATPTAAGARVMGATLSVGPGYTPTAYAHLDMAELATWKSALTDANLVSIRDYLNTTYGKGLT